MASPPQESSPLLVLKRPQVASLKVAVDEFVEKHCIPAEQEFHEHLQDRHGEHRWAMDAIPPCVSRLQQVAREQYGLWNMFIPPRMISEIPKQYQYLLPKVPLSYREYGILCESLGRSPILAPQACNCSAPDTGNMEVLMEFGTPEQKDKYLWPLLSGEIRSTFLMTEPHVASSDPTNLETTLTPQGNGTYLLNGTKWWSSGAMDPRCRVALVVAKNVSDRPLPKHEAHSIVLVELPQPRVKMQRALQTFGYDDAPFGHAQVMLDQVVIKESDFVVGPGQGFFIAQARLGPGRIHHCMRAIGMAARCYELMLQRTLERRTFGKYLWEHGGCQEMIADSFAEIQSARLLTLQCAAMMDQQGIRASRDWIAMIKVAVPQLALQVVDRAVQVFGGAGVCQDVPLAHFLAALRTLRIADGPDAVHKRTVALMEIRKAKKNKPKTGKLQSRL